MIDLQEIYEWRWIDESNGLVLPYYTRTCLDWLLTIDLSDKTVFEYGCGASSIWYADKCKCLYGVDNNLEWFHAVTHEIGNKSFFDLQTTKEKYNKSIYQWEKKFDIIIVDGIERDRCIIEALKNLNEDGILIVDNWMQESADYIASVYIINKLLAKEHKIYSQVGHPDWKTLVVFN